MHGDNRAEDLFWDDLVVLLEPSTTLASKK